MDPMISLVYYWWPENALCKVLNRGAVQDTRKNTQKEIISFVSSCMRIHSAVIMVSRHNIYAYICTSSVTCNYYLGSIVC